MDQKLRQFFGDSPIYLVSDNKLDRISWRKVLTNLGAKPELVVFFENFEKARQAIVERPPKGLICAYEIKERLADETLKAFREQSYNVAADFSLVALEREIPSARLAQKELVLDDCLLKPYSAADLERKLKSILESKLSMSAQDKAICAHWEHLRKGQFDQVKALIESLDKKGAKGERFFGLKARLLQLSGQAQEAAEVYEQGAALYPTYTLMSGRFDALFEAGHNQKAYEAALALMDKRCFHPKRLSNFIRSCILSKNYQGFVDFAFKRCQKESLENCRQVAAGLVICSRAIGERDKKLAAKANQLAIELAWGKKEIVEQALNNLLGLKRFLLTEKILEGLEEFEELSDMLDVIRYRLMERTEESAFQVFRVGMELTNRGAHDFHVYEILLRAAKKAGRKQSSLEDMIHNASKLYPEKKSYFMSLVA